MRMPIHVCIHLSLQIAKRSAIRKTQCRIRSGHAVSGLVEPAVWPDLSLVRGGGVENYFALNGVLDSGQWSRSQFFGQNTTYSTVCTPGYLQRRDEGLRD